MRQSEFDNLKIGDQIRTWCIGKEVGGPIVERDQRSVTIKHEPVNWAGETYDQTTVLESTPLQKMFYSDTTPYAEKL